MAVIYEFTVFQIIGVPAAKAKSAIHQFAAAHDFIAQFGPAQIAAVKKIFGICAVVYVRRVMEIFRIKSGCHAFTVKNFIAVTVFIISAVKSRPRNSRE